MKRVKVDILVLVVAFVVSIAGLVQVFHDTAYAACYYQCDQSRCECRWRPGIGDWNGEGYCYSTLPLVSCEHPIGCDWVYCSEYCNMWGDSLSCVGDGPT